MAEGQQLKFQNLLRMLSHTIFLGLEKDPGVLLKDPGVLLKDPGALLKDPGSPSVAILAQAILAQAAA